MASMVVRCFSYNKMKLLMLSLWILRLISPTKHPRFLDKLGMT